VVHKSPWRRSPSDCEAPMGRCYRRKSAIKIVSGQLSVDRSRTKLAKKWDSIEDNWSRMKELFWLVPKDVARWCREPGKEEVVRPRWQSLRKRANRLAKIPQLSGEGSAFLCNARRKF
jgi:hypothetical protein